MAHGSHFKRILNKKNLKKTLVFYFCFFVGGTNEELHCKENQNKYLKTPPQEECTIVLSTLRTNVSFIQPLHHTMGMLG